jgi:sensor histidine kinase YesM
METSHHNKGTGFGLNSIKRRLHLLFNQQNLLKTEIKETQFITTILIPQAHD